MSRLLVNCRRIGRILRIRHLHSALTTAQTGLRPLEQAIPAMVLGWESKRTVLVDGKTRCLRVRFFIDQIVNIDRQ
jgi:hypothetical protein